MKKVVRLTEADLTRIVKRVIEEAKYASHNMSPNRKYNDWMDADDIPTDVDFEGMDFDEEEFDNYDDFKSKHGSDTKWVRPGAITRKTFKKYAKNGPIKVRSTRD